MRKTIRTAFLGTCLGVLAFAAAPAHATFPGGNGKIAFQSNRDGNFEIYTMNADGTSQTRLTFNGASDFDPSWNAAGTKIAFASNRDGNFEIYTMNADGTAQTRLTNNAVTDGKPAWSPDGTKIVFDTNRDGNFEIYTMNADGTVPTRLTNNPALDSQAAWSPDGTKIAFRSDRDGDGEIFKMNADGTGQTNLTNNTANDEFPNWSNYHGPDIYFDNSGGSGGSLDIDWINDSGVFEGQFGTSSPEYAPAPAPDPRSTGGLDETFAYSADLNGNTDIYVCVYGANCQTRLTTNAAVDEHPNWQPVVRNYARPKGATPLRVSLVPAYKQCAAGNANSVHGGHPNVSSCVPPTPESTYLTLGTADFNGAVTNSVGSVAFRAKTTSPEDITITVSYTDVRCAVTSGGCSNGALSDYAGNLRLTTAFRITDRQNGGTGPGTVTDLPVEFNVPCATTPVTTIGSTCSVTTSINTWFGGNGVIADTKRAIWEQTDLVKLYDGGADGIASTTGDNTLFARGGLFIP
jgi:TolB protein